MMKVIIMATQEQKDRFFAATRSWQRSHNHIYGELVSASYPICATNYELGLVLQLIVKLADGLNIARAIAIAAGVEFYEESQLI